MAAFRISKGWRHEKARVVIRGWLIYLHHLLGNCRAAVIYFILFNLLSSFLLSTEQGSMSLCWIYFSSIFNQTAVHDTRFNVPVLDALLHSLSSHSSPSYSSLYINLFLQRSVTPSNGHQQAHRSFKFLFVLHQQ